MQLGFMFVSPFLPCDISSHRAKKRAGGLFFAAAGNEVERRIVYGSFDSAKAEQSMKDVVVRPAAGCFFAQAFAVDPQGVGVVRIKPYQHGDAGLLFRRDHIGGGVQVNAVFAERFPVVGNVEHNDVVAVGKFFQTPYGFGQNMGSIGDRIVIGVDDFRLRTKAQVFGLTGRRIAFKGRRITVIIGGTVAALLVEDDQRVSGQGVCPGDEVLQQNFVFAGIVAAKSFGFHPVAVVFAAGVVFPPEDAIAGAGKNVKQVFGVDFAAGFEISSAGGGKHAGQRNGGRGAAGNGVGKVKQVTGIGQQVAVGVAGIAAE